MGYEVQTTASNSGTWGSVLNTSVIEYIDVNFAGVTTLSLTGAATTSLTAAQARNQMVRVTGTLTGNQIISPDVGVLWNGIRCIENVTSGSFTVTLTNSAGSVAIPQGRRAVVFLDTTTGPRIVAIAGSSTADPVPAGSKTIWYNTAAPSGWTAVALNNYAVKIVTAGDGGVTSGTSPYTTVFGLTATDATTLTANQIPSHQHFVAYWDNDVGVGDVDLTASNYLNSTGQNGIGSPQYFLRGTTNVANTGLSSAIGGGASHTHAIDLRVNTAAFTLATRD